MGLIAAADFLTGGAGYVGSAVGFLNAAPLKILLKLAPLVTLLVPVRIV